MSSAPTIAQRSYNAGELSPLLLGRTDLDAYRDAVEICEAFVPLIQGPLLKAPGTIFVEHPKAQCRLIEFVPFVTQAYMIEASAFAFRFYTNNARIGGGSPYQVAHPWTLDQLYELDYQRSGDVIYLFHGDFQQRKLSRTGATTFELDTFDFLNGPFEDGNTDETVTVSVTGTETTTTIDANRPIFDPADVGSLFQIQALDFSDVRAWEPSYKPNYIGDLVRSAGKVYQCVALSSLSHTKTGTVPPTHTEGEEWDGLDGDKETTNGTNGGSLKWRYLYDRFGIVKITEYISPTQVNGTVQRRLAGSLQSKPSWRWAFGAFSDRNGWPSSGAIWNDRLVLAKGSELYGSVVGDYENHRERDDDGNLTADMAFRVKLPDPNPIRWLRADKSLLIGAADAEYAAARIQNSAIPEVSRQSKYGSGSVRPIEAASRLLFVQSAGKKLRELAYSFQTDRYEAPDLTVMAEHIGRNGIAEMAYQQEPHSLVWAKQGDGGLAMLCYSPTQAVKGWARRPLGGGGIVEALAVIPNPAGDGDDVWLSVNRAGTRTIERMADFWSAGDDRETAVFVDCGLTGYSATPQTSWTGADHLAGQSCVALVDGSPVSGITVAGNGSFTTSPANNVVIGLGYTARLKTLRLEAADNLGTSQSRKKRIARLTLRVLETLGIKIKVQGLDARDMEVRRDSDAMDQPVPLYTGDYLLESVGEHERDGQIELTTAQPLPATILSHMMTIDQAPL